MEGEATVKPPPKPNIINLWEHYGGVVQGPDKGGWRKATCPIHEDRSPSASVNEDQCRWHCFVCDKSGDALDLIKEMTGVTRYAELVKLAEGFLGGSDSQVREEPGSSSGLSRRPGRRSPRGHFTPAWRRL